MGSGVLCIVMGYFKPCSAGEIHLGNSNLDLQKPGSQMLPHCMVQLRRGRRGMEIACCTALVCFLLPPCTIVPPLLSVNPFLFRLHRGGPLRATRWWSLHHWQLHQRHRKGPRMWMYLLTVFFCKSNTEQDLPREAHPLDTSSFLTHLFQFMFLSNPGLGVH